MAESAQRQVNPTGLSDSPTGNFRQIAASRPLCCCDNTRVAGRSGQVQNVPHRGDALRAIAAMTLACALGACASGNMSTPLAGGGEWKIEQRADRVADQPVQSAMLSTKSRNAKATNQNPAKPQLASLQLLCFDGDPVVRLFFTHDVGSDRNSRLTYKFNDKPAVRPNARILQDFQTVMIEDQKDVAAFAGGLRDARTLDVTVSALISGQTIAEFNVEGGAAAIDASYKTCPVPAAPAPRVRGRSAAR